MTSSAFVEFSFRGENTKVVTISLINHSNSQHIPRENTVKTQAIPKVLRLKAKIDIFLTGFEAAS